MYPILKIHQEKILILAYDFYCNMLNWELIKKKKGPTHGHDSPTFLLNYQICPIRIKIIHTSNIYWVLT